MKYKSAKELAMEAAMTVVKEDPQPLLDKSFLEELFDCAWENQYEELPRQNAKSRLREIIDKRAADTAMAEKEN